MLNLFDAQLFLNKLIRTTSKAVIFLRYFINYFNLDRFYKVIKLLFKLLVVMKMLK